MRSSLLLLTFFGSLLGSLVHGQGVEGHWQSGCQWGLQKQQNVVKSQVHSIESFFSDRNCSKLSFKFETLGQNEYSIENPSWVNFTFREINLSVYVQAAIDDLNFRKVCGLTDWQTGKAQVITGRQCALFNVHKQTQIPRALDRKYGIYAIENQRLYYGVLTKENDGSTPEKRPMKLSTDFLFQTLRNSLD